MLVVAPPATVAAAGAVESVRLAEPFVVHAALARPRKTIIVVRIEHLVVSESVDVFQRLIM
jgi:cysteine sulfinate desulfinase/cysteine desulfurase-like protein